MGVRRALPAQHPKVFANEEPHDDRLPPLSGHPVAASDWRVIRVFSAADLMMVSVPLTLK